MGGLSGACSGRRGAIFAVAAGFEPGGCRESLWTAGDAGHPDLPAPMLVTVHAGEGAALHIHRSFHTAARFNSASSSARVTGMS